MIPFDIVVAMDLDSGIGKKGILPWRLSGDLRHFKQLTSQTQNPSKNNIVMMGRKTWDSLPKKFRPLPQRINLVLTHNKNLKFPQGVLTADNFESGLGLLDGPALQKRIETVFVIGGGEVFQAALKDPHCCKIYVTQILGRFGCDTFFPEFKSRFKEVSHSQTFTENSLQYYFALYSPI